MFSLIRRKWGMTLIMGCIYLGASVSAASEDQDELFVIDDEQIYVDQVSYVTTLSGFRSFPVRIVYGAVKQEDPEFDMSILARSFSIVHQEQGVTGSGETLSADVTVGELMAFAGTKAKLQSDQVSETLMLYFSEGETLTELPVKTGELLLAEYDPGFMVRTLSTELIDLSTFQNISANTPVSQLTSVKVNRDMALDMIAGYQTIDSLADMKPTQVSEQFSVAESRLARYSSFTDAAKVAVANVSIGIPILLTAEEESLRVPLALGDAFKFYVVLFAVSIKENVDMIESITFSVALPEGCIAFDLFPLRYGTEVDVTEEFSSPDVKIDAAQLSVEFSSIFKKKFGYKILRSTIVAYGLQENEFAWTFRGDAARQGSHRLAAVIGFPKAMTQVSSALSVFAETRRMLLLEGDVASSAPRVVNLAIR